MATRYSQLQVAGDNAVRAAALDAASDLLESEGPGALTMRRIAAGLGCSTTVLYRMFGAKAGLADDLFVEGFDRLRQALEGVPWGEPLARLSALGQAYRQNALANHAYYSIMFGRPIPGFEPSAEARVRSGAALQVLVDAVDACVDAGAFGPCDPLQVAGVLWAAVHGAVSLELAGLGEAIEPEQRFEEITAATIAWYLAAAPGPSRRASDAAVRPVRRADPDLDLEPET